MHTERVFAFFARMFRAFTSTFTLICAQRSKYAHSAMHTRVLSVAVFRSVC